PCRCPALGVCVYTECRDFSTRYVAWSMVQPARSSRRSDFLILALVRFGFASCIALTAAAIPMSAQPLRCVSHVAVFVFVVTFSACDCLLCGNITTALLAAQSLRLNHCVEARERLMDGYTRVDELPEPVPDFRMVDAGRVFDDLLECFFDSHVSVPFWVLENPGPPCEGEPGLCGGAVSV